MEHPKYNFKICFGFTFNFKHVGGYFQKYMRTELKDKFILLQSFKSCTFEGSSNSSWKNVYNGGNVVTQQDPCYRSAGSSADYSTSSSLMMYLGKHMGDQMEFQGPSFSHCKYLGSVTGRWKISLSLPLSLSNVAFQINKYSKKEKCRQWKDNAQNFLKVAYATLAFWISLFIWCFHIHC